MVDGRRIDEDKDKEKFVNDIAKYQVLILPCVKYLNVKRILFGI